MTEPRKPGAPEQDTDTAPTVPAMQAQGIGQPRARKPASIADAVDGIENLSRIVHSLTQTVAQEGASTRHDRALTNSAIQVLGERVGNLDSRLAVYERNASVPPAAIVAVPTPVAVGGDVMIPGLRPRVDSITDREEAEEEAPAMSGSLSLELRMLRRDLRKVLTAGASNADEAKDFLHDTNKSQTLKIVLATVSAVLIAWGGQYFTQTREVQKSAREGARQGAEEAPPRIVPVAVPAAVPSGGF